MTPLSTSFSSSLFGPGPDYYDPPPVVSSDSDATSLMSPSDDVLFSWPSDASAASNLSLGSSSSVGGSVVSGVSVSAPPFSSSRRYRPPVDTALHARLASTRDQMVSLSRAVSLEIDSEVRFALSSRGRALQTLNTLLYLCVVMEKVEDVKLKLLSVSPVDFSDNLRFFGKLKSPQQQAADLEEEVNRRGAQDLQHREEVWTLMEDKMNVAKTLEGHRLDIEKVADMSLECKRLRREKDELLRDKVLRWTDDGFDRAIKEVARERGEKERCEREREELDEALRLAREEGKRSRKEAEELKKRDGANIATMERLREEVGILKKKDVANKESHERVSKDIEKLRKLNKEITEALEKATEGVLIGEQAKEDLDRVRAAIKGKDEDIASKQQEIASLRRAGEEAAAEKDRADREVALLRAQLDAAVAGEMEHLQALATNDAAEREALLKAEKQRAERKAEALLKSQLEDIANKQQEITRLLRAVEEAAAEKDRADREVAQLRAQLLSSPAGLSLERGGQLAASAELPASAATTEPEPSASAAAKPAKKKMGGMLMKAKRTGVLENQVDAMDAAAAAAAAAPSTLPDEQER